MSSEEFDVAEEDCGSDQFDVAQFDVFSKSDSDGIVADIEEPDVKIRHRGPAPIATSSTGLECAFLVANAAQKKTECPEMLG